jgi:hypothetical protein
VFDGDSDESTDIEVANGRLVAVSNGGFGTSANPIETTLNSIDLTNSTTGDVNIYELDGIKINGLTQNVDGKDIKFSYSGSISGQDKAIVPDGSVGTISFEQRQQVVRTKDQILEGTGKSLGFLSVESTVQLAKTVESDVMQMILQNNGSGSKTVANFGSSGLTGPYKTDVFNDPYSLVEFSKDSKESYGGSSAIENFWGKSAEELQVARLEPPLDSCLRVGVGSSLAT